jgi:hypothetical protein
MKYLWLVAVLGSSLAGCNSESGSGPVSDGPVSPDPLAVDCKVSKNAADPLCVRTSKTTQLGTGPRPMRFGGAIKGGFLDGNRLVFAATTPGLYTPAGVVMTLDIETGNRQVISGHYEDPIEGPIVVGSGGSLGYTMDVAKGPDGWYAVTRDQVPLSPPKHVFKVDPATGARTAVATWGYKVGMPENTFQCKTPSGSNIFPTENSLAVGPDGTIYLNVFGMEMQKNGETSAHGIVAIRDTSCRIVTLTIGAGETGGVGSGPSIISSYYSLRFSNGKLYGLASTNQSLVEIDPATGARRRISSSSSSTPVGSSTGYGIVGSEWLAFEGDNRAWVIGSSSSSGYPTLASIDLATGDRVGHPGWAPGYGPVWVHPQHKWLILADGGGFNFYDPSVGNRNNLSY